MSEFDPDNDACSYNYDEDDCDGDCVNCTIEDCAFRDEDAGSDYNDPDEDIGDEDWDEG